MLQWTKSFKRLLYSKSLKSFWRYRMLRLVFRILLLAPLVGGAVSADQNPPGRLLDVGGFKLHLYCAGEGSPTVVLDAGLGGSANDWSKVQPLLRQTTRVCTYTIGPVTGGATWAPFPALAAASHRNCGPFSPALRCCHRISSWAIRLGGTTRAYFPVFILTTPPGWCWSILPMKPKCRSFFSTRSYA